MVARRQLAREAATRVIRDGLATMGPDARSLVKRTAVTAASPAGDVILPELREYFGPNDFLTKDLFSLALTLDESEEGLAQCV